MLTIFLLICFVAVWAAPEFGGYGSDTSSLKEWASHSSHHSNGGGAR